MNTVEQIRARAEFYTDKAANLGGEYAPRAARLIAQELNWAADLVDGGHSE